VPASDERSGREATPRRRREPSKRSQPPVVSAHEIVRLRLLDRVTSSSTNATTARLTLVRGPAGFGKTILLAQAYRQVIARGDVAVWLDCSEFSGDAQPFVDSLYAAADLTGIDRSEVEFTPSDLAARLADIDPRVYVFLDEFERLVGTAVETVSSGSRSPCRALRRSFSRRGSRCIRGSSSAN
jgi:LuxR family maltose regulon positive regulatory protein